MVVEVATGGRIARVAKGDGTRSVQFSGDGLFLCTGDAKRARIWESSGRELLSAKDRPVSAEAVAMTRTARLMALISRDGLFLWDRTTHRASPRPADQAFRRAGPAVGVQLGRRQAPVAVDNVLEMIALPSGAMLWAPTSRLPFWPPNSRPMTS